MGNLVDFVAHWLICRTLVDFVAHWLILSYLLRKRRCGGGDGHFARASGHAEIGESPNMQEHPRKSENRNHIGQKRLSKGRDATCYFAVGT